MEFFRCSFKVRNAFNRVLNEKEKYIFKVRIYFVKPFFISNEEEKREVREQREDEKREPTESARWTREAAEGVEHFGGIK